MKKHFFILTGILLTASLLMSGGKEITVEDIEPGTCSRSVMKENRSANEVSDILTGHHLLFMN